MPLPPIGPGWHLLGPGRIRLPGGQGDPVHGGVGVGLAQVVAGRHGHRHLARHMPRGGAGLAAGACQTSRERREPSLRTLPASLGGRPPPVPAGRSPPVPLGGSPCSSGNRGRGLYLRLVWCRISGDHAKNGTCICGEVYKAQIEKGGKVMRQCNNKKKKLDEIHRNSYEIRANFKFPEYSHKFIHVKFVRISYEFHVNFVQFANKQSPHTSKHTLHSHGHVMDHAPVFAHLGDRHAGAVFARCHSVVGRSGGAMPVVAKWISNSASALSPLHTSSWCTLPTKNSMHCSPTSMTARSEAGADRERKVGWKGQVEGLAGTDSGGSAKRAWAASPSHNPTLLTALFPTHNTWSTQGKSQLDKSPATSKASFGGVGSRCVVLGWWCLCVWSGVHK